MQFQKLQFSPGINRESTDYSNVGGWYDGSRVRFRNGLPEKIGGWSKINSSAFSGTSRLVMRHRILVGRVYTFIFTHTHVYIEDGGTLNDITPWVDRDLALANPFTTVNTSSDVEVTKASHDRAVGDRIDIVSASTTNGILAAELNGERIVSEIVSANAYKFTSGGTATSSGTGGGTVDIYYILKVGLDFQVFGDGWGADPFGSGGWGDAASSVISGEGTIRLWSADAFGEDVVMTPSGSGHGIFYWDATNGVSARATPLSAVGGATDTPQNCSIVKTSDKDRHVISFGGDTFETPGTADPLVIRWADQETAAIWTPGTTTTSGQLFVTGGNEIVSVQKIRQQFLVWTDDTLHSLSYIGGVYTYGLDTLARNVDIIGRNSSASLLGVAYWMGRRGFYAFDGQVREIPCAVEDYVFTDIDLTNTEKVFAGTNTLFNEIIWHYPSVSGGALENDRYVCFNTTDGSWSFGSLVRTAWTDILLSQYPIAAGTDGYIYYHEFGNADGSANPPVSLDAFIESSPVEIGDGYDMMHVDWFIPDVTFRGADVVAPSLLVTLKMADAPGKTFHDTGSGSVARTATSPEQYTSDVWVRLRGRSLIVRYDDDVDTENADVAWRIGTPRVRMRSDGRR